MCSLCGEGQCRKAKCSFTAGGECEEPLPKVLEETPRTEAMIDGLRPLARQRMSDTALEEHARILEDGENAACAREGLADVQSLHGLEGWRRPQHCSKCEMREQLPGRDSLLVLIAARVAIITKEFL